MIPTCARCGVVLSFLSDRCHACGHLIAPTITLSSTQIQPGPNCNSQRGGSPAEPLSNEDEGAKVERLLDQIAAQSHFEERYELRDVLDSGGMGQVYRAYDSILRREVAIKMMRESHGSETPAIRGQFLKETRIGGKLLHPHILPVFDLGVNRAGNIYYTMRLVQGASLQSCLDALSNDAVTKLVSWPLHRFVETLLGACQGVDYAHQKGVLHLDLKPHNILVSGFDEVFVIDWGLARVGDFDDTEQLIDLYRDPSNSSQTGSNTAVVGGQVIGTPGYMAPEQAMGDLGSYNATTDVYGLGGVLYFILYGTAPNQGLAVREQLKASCTPKKNGQLRQAILPRGRRVGDEILNAVRALEKIALKALHPAREYRYATVEAMIIEVNEWLTHTQGLIAETSTAAKHQPLVAEPQPGSRKWWQIWK